MTVYSQQHDNYNILSNNWSSHLLLIQLIHHSCSIWCCSLWTMFPYGSLSLMSFKWSWGKYCGRSKFKDKPAHICMWQFEIILESIFVHHIMLMSLDAKLHSDCLYTIHHYPASTDTQSLSDNKSWLLKYCLAVKGKVQVSHWSSFYNKKISNAQMTSIISIIQKMTRSQITQKSARKQL